MKSLIQVLQRHLLVDSTCLVPLCCCRFCQHQRPKHAGKEGQRGGRDRGGLGDGDGGDGRAGIPGGKIRSAAATRVLQVLKRLCFFFFFFLFLRRFRFLFLSSVMFLHVPPLGFPSQDHSGRSHRRLHRRVGSRQRPVLQGGLDDHLRSQRHHLPEGESDVSPLHSG